MKKPNTLNLRRKGSIAATITPVWTGAAYRFQVELFEEHAGVVVTMSKLSDAMDWAELATSDLAKAA